MHRRSRLRLLGAAAAVATAAGLAATMPATAAQVPKAPVAHFVVVGTQGQGFDKTERAVVDSGGAIVKSWPQIGVVVATSSDPGFAKVVRGKHGVTSAGATRNLVELAAPRSARAKAEEKTSAVVRSKIGTLAEPEPLAANQWDMKLINAEQAHAVTAGSPDVLVGVLDSGIEATHPDLAPNIDAANSVGCVDEGVPDPSPAAWAPTTSDHGTHVAGIIAAARNGVGIVGVAPGVKLASIKVVDDGGFIYPEYAICGFVWAAEHGVKVTNNSYFVDPWLLWCGDDPDQRAGAEAVNRAIQYAHRNDVVNVAALGNNTWDLSKNIVDDQSPDNGTPITRNTGSNCVDIPAESNNVVGVSSVGFNKIKAYYSNYGRTETEVAAPGGDRMQIPNTPDANGRVLSTVTNGSWGYKQGTSMAAPHVAGVVALIRSVNPGRTRQHAISVLENSATRTPCPLGVDDPDGTGQYAATCEGGYSGRGFYGAGIIDALDAVR